ncbi:MAG TPA: hypothetical protein VFF73_02140 [Planctomycetota bacterium]|nr:hypothetical protein [Planctomycetota bacterium]
MGNHVNLGSQIKAIRAGLKTGLPAGTTSLTVGNVSYSIPDLDKALATEEAYYDNASAAHVASQAAVRERDARVGTARALVDDFKSAIRGLLGTQNETLLQFGVKPKKAARKLTADEKALAAARNRATRKARGTVGPRARAAIHGADVTQVTVGQAPTPPPKTA